MITARKSFLGPLREGWESIKTCHASKFESTQGMFLKTILSKPQYFKMNMKNLVPNSALQDQNSTTQTKMP